MALVEFLAELDRLLDDAEQAFAAVTDTASLEAARVEFLGAKSGRLKNVQKGLGTVEKSEKPAAGKRLNEVKEALETAFIAAEQRIAGPGSDAAGNLAAGAAGGSAAAKGPRPDLTLPGREVRLGHLHPIAQTIEHLKEIMGRLGFSAAGGPEIEDEWHNFQALNIPAAHPARDPLENFYLSTAAVTTPDSTANVATPPAARAAEGPMLLRSQTSTVQIRVMENTPPPVRIISLGRVYRPDTADATHYPMFHQIEGLLIDRHVTMADLKSVLRLFARSYFGGDVHIRFRPSFFPFTEPSVEVDMSWNDSWIEMGGAGMVDPNVLAAVGYDPEQVSGFAFGLGVERVCARRHNVTDIREFYKNDVRFLEQF
ncbi:MAG: phenylalanine--tRNA ligase subunit alpha [Singulisphaera sp.]